MRPSIFAAAIPGAGWTVSRIMLELQVKVTIFPNGQHHWHMPC